ncbi:hypothetical protein [Legionella cardiaca]|uniref:J domain-containing protein n=1 Tax=Legionella cardiaca TaxID=1071983 RepID=A0ABY8AWF6_9GAMM|nr:hypothetical protein [Legionella cardiaca]WED43825.1 hypothetical protein PXX05_03325 [Legionella cardiaca]
MDFEAHLKELISEYADFDKEHCIYKDKKSIGLEEKQKIEANLIALISQYLSQDGLVSETIHGHAKKLQLLFHPDKYPVSSPESKWLQYTLSSGCPEKAPCFYLVELSEKKLTNPDAPEFHFQSASSMEALIERIKRDRENATTHTQRALLDSILVMLSSAEEYNGDVNNNISVIWAQRITQLMPYLTTGYCVSFFLEELALLYAVTFTLSRGGQWLEHSSSVRCQTVGHMMRMFGDSIFSAATALIARLTELNIFMIRGAINLSIDAGGGIYKLLTAPSPENSHETTNTTNENKALIVAPQDLFGGLRFKTFELKVVAMSLEKKSKQLEGQWLLDWRLGSQKNAAIKEALRALRVLDRSDVDLKTKLEEAEKVIKKLISNKTINVKGSDTNKAIRIAQRTLQLILHPVSNEETKQLAICSS